MVPESSRKKTFAPAILGVAGGVLALVAYTLHWGTVAILSGGNMPSAIRFAGR